MIRTTNSCCGNEAGLVEKFIGTAYDVVKTVYDNLGELQFIYDFLNKYGVLITVSSVQELQALPTTAKYTRVYSTSTAGERIYTDYLYVEGDRTGVLPSDPTATGSWVVVGTSTSGGSGASGGYIPFVYNNGSALGGETTITVPDGTVGVPFIIVGGYTNYVGKGFTYSVADLEVTLAQPLETGDEVVLLLTGVPAVPDNPNVDNWTVINWLYNQGAAVGGEQVIQIPYTFQDIPAVYKNGLRFYKGLITNSYTIDADNQRIILTEALATNDRVIIQIGGELVTLETSDRTLEEVARAANVKDSEVILSTNTTSTLNGMTVVYDVLAQKSYGLPTLPTNVYIYSVSNGQLTYQPGNVTVDLMPLPNSADKILNQLNEPDGSGEIGYGQITVESRLSQEVFITDFGGGESVADNLPALNLAKTAAGVGGKVRFPKRGNGIYNFPSGFPDFSGIVVSPDDGIVMQGPATPNMAVSSIVTDNNYRVYFNSGDPHNYYIDIRSNFKHGSKFTNKSLWLSDGDIRDTSTTIIDANTIPVKQVALGVGDTFTDVVPAGRSSSSLFLQPPSGGNTQLGLVTLYPGREVSVGVNNLPDNNGEIACGLVFTTGYAVLRGYPNSGTWSLSVKYASTASTDIAVVPDGGNIATYSASNVLMTVRMITTIRCQILINGVVMVDFQANSGVIQYAGFGNTSITSASSTNITGWYSKDVSIAKGPRSQTLGIIGDSISDGSVHGAWPEWCSTALDSSLGVRINGIENRAISGQTLDQQIANLAAHPFVNASIVAVFIGTNDIQGGNDLNSFKTSLNTLLNTLGTQGRQSVLVIPPNWYLSSDAPGLPVNGTVNSNKGGDIRAAIGRIAAERGLQVVDLTQVTGPVNPGYVSSSFADSILRDCMHPTAYAYRIFGYEIARAIMAQLCPVIKRTSEWVSVTNYASGVTGTAQWRYNNGEIDLRGELNITTPANGVVFTLPVHIAPPVIRRFVQWGTNDFIKTAINTNGTVEVVNSNSTVMSLDNIHY